MKLINTVGVATALFALGTISAPVAKALSAREVGLAARAYGNDREGPAKRFIMGHYKGVDPEEEWPFGKHNLLVLIGAVVTQSQRLASGGMPTSYVWNGMS